MLFSRVSTVVLSGLVAGFWVIIGFVAWSGEPSATQTKSPGSASGHATAASALGAVAQPGRIESEGPEFRVFTGHIRSNFPASTAQSGLPEAIARQVLEIFRWDLDFGRDCFEGDGWRVVVEVKEKDPAGVEKLGEILAASYDGRERSYMAVRYPSRNGQADYYRTDGTLVRGHYLASPVDSQVAWVSSPFQVSRFHPILRRLLPHLGTDYAAPKGTPVLAIADGTVARLETTAGGGKTVLLAHGPNDTSAYKHLSDFAVGLRVGQSVKMGQPVGRVGSTGLATGPHLHFEYRQGGRLVDYGSRDRLAGRGGSSGRVVMRARLPREELPTFFALAERYLDAMPSERPPAGRPIIAADSR